MLRKQFASVFRWRHQRSTGKNRVLKAGQPLNNDCKTMPSRQLMELLSRALLDRALCHRLFADPDATAREFDLSAEESQAIKLLDRRKFDQSVARLRWG